MSNQNGELLTNPEQRTEELSDERLRKQKEVEFEFEMAFDKSRSFGDRIKAFIRGENKAGRKVGMILDAAMIFLPRGYSDARQAAQAVINPTQKPMLDKILSIKNIVNVRDEEGNISAQEIAASTIQLIITGAIVYGAVQLGIWNELSQLLTE